MNQNDLLERIDAKLFALLTISVDRYLRETGIARPKKRSIDRILSDVGLTASEIADLLGKTERAVYKNLSAEQGGTGSSRISKRSSASRGPKKNPKEASN